jgi:hypothetical protein
MDVAEIIVVLNNHGFEDTDTTEKMEALNDAYYDFCSREDWPFLEAEASLSITSGSVNVTEPTDLSKVLAIRIASIPRKLVPERYENIITADPDLAVTGAPRAYYFVGDQLRIYPTPDANYTASIYYSRFPTELSSSEVEANILIPKRHQRLLVTGTLYKLYLMEDDPDLSNQFERHFENRIERVRADMHNRQLDRTDYIVDVNPESYDEFGYHGA